jgi:hypothetical protein
MNRHGSNEATILCWLNRSREQHLPANNLALAVQAAGDVAWRRPRPDPGAIAAGLYLGIILMVGALTGAIDRCARLVAQGAITALQPVPASPCRW